MKKFFEFLNLYKYPVLAIVLFMFILLISLFFSTTQKLSTKLNQPSNFVSVTPYLISRPLRPTPSFSVLDTSPKNNDINISAGEIIISFTTNVPIYSQNDFSMTIAPALPFYWTFTNSYPTNVINAQVKGGLTLNTTYNVIIKNKNGQEIHSWKFTTSNIKPESSSGLVGDNEKKINQQYFPLFNFTPYYSLDFTAYYTDYLTLKILMKNPNIALVQKEVNDWIRSHGVDPSTHTINYVKDY